MMKVNKDKPLEISYKKPVKFITKRKFGEKPRGFDPRFDPRCGEFHEGAFRKSYAFLDEIKDKETKALKEELQKCKNTDFERANKIREILKIRKTQEMNRKMIDLRKEAVNEVVRDNIERMNSGKKPIFLKPHQMKERVLNKKYEYLKKEGNITKYLEKKSKKNNDPRKPFK
uniref:rRNA biogenesis protein RRP36 n=1 Tax=Parastrongyloides trichosuri TaxID=131310 RepID=A0A0N4ZZ62_PARTI